MGSGLVLESCGREIRLQLRDFGFKPRNFGPAASELDFGFSFYGR